MRPLGRSNFFTLEVLDGLDATFFIHIKGAEAKQARANHRQAYDVGVFTGDLSAKFGKRELRQIKLTIGGETCKTLMVTQGEPIQINAFGLDGASSEIAKMIVIGRGNGEFQLRH